MPRLLGLAFGFETLQIQSGVEKINGFSVNGNEVAFGSDWWRQYFRRSILWNHQCSRVLQVPMAISVWDDGYGISVPTKYQTTKQNISEILKGFERNDKGEGYVILRGKGWDYPGLCELYEKVFAFVEQHVPVLFHIQEVTQPQGHSTSGSHERFPNQKNDCNGKMNLMAFAKWKSGSFLPQLPQQKNVIELMEKRKSLQPPQKKAWDDFCGIPSKQKYKLSEHCLNPLLNPAVRGAFIRKVKSDLESMMILRAEIFLRSPKSTQIDPPWKFSCKNCVDWLVYSKRSEKILTDIIPISIVNPANPQLRLKQLQFNMPRMPQWWMEEKLFNLTLMRSLQKIQDWLHSEKILVKLATWTRALPDCRPSMEK